MEKIIPLGSWHLNEPVSQIVKVSSRGLIGHDLREFLKRAAVDFTKDLPDFRPDPNESLVHLIAMGSTEFYGPNRNGDGFKEAALKQYHDTFVKNAYNYRNHKNKDPKISYGRVKASKYNDIMHRVELLVGFWNNEKAAADHGAVYAGDNVLKRVHDGDDVPWSMACKIAYDVCASCGNQAKTRDEYCTEDSCVGPRGEKRGGCRTHLAQTAYDGFINHVDNPHPKFFDISHLVVGDRNGKPADRIAWGSLADYLPQS